MQAIPAITPLFASAPTKPTLLQTADQGCGYLFRRMQGVPTGAVPALPSATGAKPLSRRVMFNELELIRDFIAESYDKLTRVRAALPQLAAQGENQQTLSSLFWALHSIRDGAGVLGLTEIRRLAHAMEKLLVALLDQGCPQNSTLPHPVLVLLQEGLESLDQKLAAKVGRLREEPRPTGVAEVPSLMQRLETVLANFAPLGEDGSFYWRVMANSEND